MIIKIQKQNIKHVFNTLHFVIKICTDQNKHNFKGTSLTIQLHHLIKL